MARVERKFRTKVLVSTLKGVRTETPFDVSGKNARERDQAEADYIIGMKRLICQEGHEYVCSYFKDEIIKEKK